MCELQLKCLLLLPRGFFLSLVCASTRGVCISHGCFDLRGGDLGGDDVRKHLAKLPYTPEHILLHDALGFIHEITRAENIST